MGERSAGGDAGQGRGRVREAPRRLGGRARGARRFSRGRGRRQAAGRGAARAGGGAHPRLRVLEDDALGRRGPSLSASRALAARDARLDEDRRPTLVRPPVPLRADRDRGRGRLSGRTARRGRRARLRGAANGDRGRSGCARRVERPECRAGGGRLPGREAGGHRRDLRRALPPAPEPCHRDHDPAPHPRLPARCEPVRVRRQRRRSRHRASGGRERRRRPARGRLVHVRARREGRNRRSGGAARVDHVLPRRRLVRGQDGPAREARRGARRGRGRARGCAACKGRPGVRAGARVPGARGPRRRGVRADRRLPGGGQRRDRRAVPARRRGCAVAQDGDGARPLGRRQDRLTQRLVRTGPAPDGLPRPVRPPARRDRPRPVGHRREPHDPA